MAFVKKLDALFVHQRSRLHRLLLRPRLAKGLRFLPNIFTFCNAFFGFCSIVFSTYGDWVAAALFIFFGALMDSLDGRIARYIRITSELGLQLDSLSDAISFCLAPAVLAFLWQLHRISFLGLGACALFLIAGLFRLARFNLTHTQQSISFLGTPTPIAGCCVAAIIMNMHARLLSPLMLLGFGLLILMLAGLMVSSIPFPTFKQLPKQYLVLAITTFWILAIIVGLPRILLILFAAYFIFAFLAYIRTFHKNHTPD